MAKNHVYPIFDFAPVGMARVSHTGKMLDVNPAFCQMVGYSKEEMLDLCFQQITHPDDLGGDLALFEQLKAGVINTYSMVKRYYHKDKSIVHVRLSVSINRNPDEEDTIIAVVEDITREVMAEKSAHALKSALDTSKYQQLDILEKHLEQVQTRQEMLDLLGRVRELKRRNGNLKNDEFMSEADDMFSQVVSTLWAGHMTPEKVKAILGLIIMGIGSLVAEMTQLADTKGALLIVLVCLGAVIYNDHIKRK